MQQFNIEIKNKNIKTYRVITFFIVMLNVLFFIYSLFDAGLRKNAFLSLALVAIYIVYRFYKSIKEKQAFFFNEWIYFLLMLLWVDYYPAAVICMILFWLYAASLQRIIYCFDSTLIKQKNFPWKKHHWDELSNVILKDDLLTIDFKKNKIMQAEIISGDIDEAEFNAFAKTQLLSS